MARFGRLADAVIPSILAATLRRSFSPIPRGRLRSVYKAKKKKYGEIQ